MDKICGSIYGVAKWSEIVILKNHHLPNGYLRVASLLGNLKAVEEDVKKRGLQGKAVINLSVTLPAELPPNNQFSEAIKGMLKILIQQHHIVVVAAAGNKKVISPPRSKGSLY